MHVAGAEFVHHDEAPTSVEVFNERSRHFKASTNAGRVVNPLVETSPEVKSARIEHEHAFSEDFRQVHAEPGHEL